MTPARVLGALLVLAAAVAAGSAVRSAVHGLTGTRARPVAVTQPVLGAYTGPAASGVRGVAAWEAWTGVAAPLALDFAAGDSWANIDAPGWLLGPWRDSGRRLVYSLPLSPDPSGGNDTLRDCAAGRLDMHWDKVGRQLVTYRLADTIVRPGWEFNGDWYTWSATGQEPAYAECFRRVVTTMRAVAGQRFEFVWNPALGIAADGAYPGDAFVDYVGVDVYDVSWLGDTYRAVRDRAWPAILDGPHGLRAWSRFAGRHGKRLALPEWGLSLRTDGHGGGDNPAFVDRMLAFIRDPANHVAFALYFDVDAAGDAHRISAADSPFPAARARLLNGWRL